MAVYMAAADDVFMVTNVVLSFPIECFELDLGLNCVTS